ncbi:MAG: methyltransferase [Clostridia bacterium]|nr:methyltransferase [Clostridia bacterium]
MTETCDEKSLLNEGERVDDLQSKGLKLIQAPAFFCFGTDSVLLTHYALDALKTAKSGGKLIDLGAGSGFISVMLAAHTRLDITAVEIDAAQCSRLERSALINGFPPSKLTVVNADYTSSGGALTPGFDYAVANPPYFKLESGGAPTHATATHEESADILGVCGAASRLLKFGGKFFFCFPASRIAEAFRALDVIGLEPKKLRFCASTPTKKPYLALITAIKGAKPGLDIEKELVITDESGGYTDEVAAWYGEK